MGRRHSMWLNITEAAEYAGVTRPTFMQWIEMGLRVAKIGSRTYRVQRVDIDSFYAEHFYEGDKTTAQNVVAEMV